MGVPSVAGMNEIEPVVVDCDTCLVRCPAVCGDCVVSVLLGPPDERVAFGADEQEALGALASSGLVPPLRLVVGLPDPHLREDPGPGETHVDAS